jgi:hypothetical protein
MASLSRLIGQGFIWSVGITKPRPGKERQAALYITGTLILCLVAAATFFVAIITHGR